MIQELINFIEQVKKTADETGLKVSDECIFNNACQFLRGEYASKKYSPNLNLPTPPYVAKSISDKSNTRGKSDSPSSTTSPIKLATDKQLAYAQKLADDTNTKIELSNKMSTKEISEVIKSLKAKKWAK